MIESFADAEAERIFNRLSSRRYAGFEVIILRKLLALDAARQFEELAVRPGNRLEALKGDRRGQQSIRMDRQYRICFRWKDGYAHEIDIVDCY